MKITIIGKGQLGAPLAKFAAAAGHRVATVGKGVDLAPAIRGAEVVVLAVPYSVVRDLTKDPNVRSALTGKIIIDSPKRVHPVKLVS